jgi:molybdate transport system ATP-binding protein
MLSCDIHYQRGQFNLNVALSCEHAVTGILGASGTGKSTLLKIIAGLLKPQQGYISFDSQTLFDSRAKICLPSHQRHIGLVFQDGQLFPHMNVQQNLLYGYRHIAPEKRRFELAQVTDLLEIRPLIQRKVGQLSGGEKQRVALGRAILYSPQLLLLDEPLAALDQRLKDQILPFLLRIRDEINIPMLYVTHQPAELTFLQADVRHMQAGRLLPAN